jgi:hypothetical protein
MSRELDPGDALHAPRKAIRGRRKERPVNVLAIYVANEQMLSLMEQSVQRKLAHSLPAGPSLRARIASAAAALRRLLENPMSSRGFVPQLKDYPHRG